MLRTISLIVAGALIAGCESTGVQGNEDYHGDVHAQSRYHGNVQGTQSYGSNVAGDQAYHREPTAEERADAAQRTATAQRTTTVERTTDTKVQPAAAKTEVTRTETVTPAPTPTPAPKTAENAAPRTTGLPAPTNTYPTGMTASDQLKVTALVDHDGNGLRVANASDKDIRDGKVWLDGTYFARVSSIPTRTTVTIDRKSFVNGSGNSPTTLQGIKSIQVQTADALYNVQGPVMDDR